MKGPDGQMIPATNKNFKIDFCTVARWKDGRIVEENLFYDSVGMMRQLGLM
jgi:ketosteroid isomerase-like protein